METERYSLLDDYHLLSYEVLDSTNDEARRCAGGGAQHGAVIWSKRQTNGKGRMGREWVSPEGNLYLSILLSPEQELAELTQLAFVAAVAAVDTLAPIVPQQGALACKWPNDILYQGKKIAGILLESFSTLEASGEQKLWIVVGVGINIESCPSQVRYPATCLFDAGVELISAKIVLSRYVYNFIERYNLWMHEGFAVVHECWMDTAYQRGAPIEVKVGDRSVSGRFEGIDMQGRLELMVDEKLLALNAGEVTYTQERQRNATCD